MSGLGSGTRLGRWVVDHVITYGSPSLVAAHRADAPQHLATIEVRGAVDDGALRQQRQVEVLRQVEHPRLARLLEAGEQGDQLFLAMHPMSSDSLSDRLVGDLVDWRQRVVWLYELAIGLAALHRAGWVHRALTPQRVLVASRHHLWITGFDCASRDDERRTLREIPDAAMAYLAPEVLRDPEHDPIRADVYAFGLIAYEVLTGDTAFPAAAWAERDARERTLLEWKTRAADLDPGPDHPEWLRSIVRACSHPVADERPAQLGSVVARLEAERDSWELPDPVYTPVSMQREGMPRLELEPALFEHAQLMALRQAQAETQRSNRAGWIFTAAVLGGMAGALASAMLILVVELTKLG